MANAHEDESREAGLRSNALATRRIFDHDHGGVRLASFWAVSVA